MLSIAKTNAYIEIVPQLTRPIESAHLNRMDARSILRTSKPVIN